MVNYGSVDIIADGWQHTVRYNMAAATVVGNWTLNADHLGFFL